MYVKETKVFTYHEKISIIKEVTQAKSRASIAAKYKIGESTIRGWENDLKKGKLKDNGNIVLLDLFDCKTKTDLIEFCEVIKDEVTDKFKAQVIIQFMINKGYKEKDLINFFEMTKTKYNKFHIQN